MPSPLLVLVRPQSGENIGLVVRLCANFGLAAPRLVLPVPGWERDAARTAAMCRELLAETRLYESLPQAAAELQEIVGFTARQGRDRQTTTVQGLGPIVAAAAAGTSAGLVFGNERTGLDDAECSHCTRLVHMPLPGMPSLNLSHAVAIALHEWHRAESTAAAEAPPRATSLDERQRLADDTRAVLGGLGYRTDDPHFEGALRRLLRAQRLERRDARILHKVLTHLDHVRLHGRGGQDVDTNS